MFRGFDVAGGKRDTTPIRVADREPLEVVVYVRRSLDPSAHERFRWLQGQLDRLADAGVVTAVRTRSTTLDDGLPFDDIGVVVYDGEEPIARYPASGAHDPRSIEDGVAALRSGRGLHSHQPREEAVSTAVATLGPR